MPIFQGEELVDVTAPDGRSYKLPASLANGLQMPQTQAVGANPMSAVPAVQTLSAPSLEELQSVTDGKIPPSTQDAQPAVQKVTPQEYKAATLNVPDAKGQEAYNKKYEQKLAKQQTAAAKQAASPQGQVAAVNNEAQAAIGQQQDAVVKEADVEAAGHTMVADAYAKRNKDIKTLAATREAEARADLEAQDRKQTEIVGMRDKIANTKIDRKADHPIAAMIAVALSGLGSAMKGESTNPGLEMLLKSIDRKVAGQMADLDQQKEVLGFTKDELATMKERAGSRLAFHNMLIAGESEKAARQVEEIVARTTSDKVRLEGQKTAALLREHGAEKTMQAVQFGLEYDQKERAEKNQNSRFYAGLNQADRHHADDMQVKREGMYLDYQSALAAANAKSGEASMKQAFELQKENDTRGVFDVKNGTPLLKQAGIELVKQADAMVQEAQTLRDLDAKSPDPNARSMAETRAKALEAKASQLRGEAYTYHTLKARDPVQAGKLAEKYGAAQSAMTLIDDIKGLYDANGGKDYLKTDAGRAAVQSKLAQLSVALKDAYQLGAWDKGSAILINSITGGDPTKGWDAQNLLNYFSGGAAGTDPEAFKGKLDSVANDLEGSVVNLLKTDTNGWDVKDPHELFARKKPETKTPEREAAKSILSDVTPVEGSEDVRARGAVRQQLSSTGRVFTGEANKTNEDVASEIENSGSIKYGNMTKSQEKKFDDLLAQYQKGVPEAGKQLLALATNEGRTGVSVPVLHALRDTAPDLYTQARAAVPKGGKLEEQLLYEEKSQVGASITPLALLAPQAVVDDGAYKELARRAVKDKQAAKALEGVIKTRSANRFMGGIQ